MSKPTPGKQQAPAKDPLLQEAEALAEYLYAKLSDFPEEEKWHTAIKLRASIVDCLYFMAIASGNQNLVGREYDWMNARKFASALTTMYRFAARQKFIELEPEIMVRLTKLSAQLDLVIATKQAESKRAQAADYEQTLKPWIEKYTIYKKLSKGKQ